MPAEDFSVCLDWSTAVSLASFEKLRSAFSKRRMALGQEPASWDSENQCWAYGSDTPMTAGDAVNFSDFFSVQQQWIMENCGGFVDPTISNWSTIDFSNDTSYCKPLTVDEIIEEENANGNLGLLRSYNGGVAIAFSHFGMVARDVLGNDDLFQGTDELGFRQSADIDGYCTGGEQLWDYIVGVGGLVGEMLPGDYMTGNPNTLTPWLFEDLAGIYSVLYKIREKAMWADKGEWLVYSGSGSGDDRAEAQSAAETALEHYTASSDADVVPYDIAISYFWPLLGEDNADCQELNGWGHYPHRPWMVIDLNMANDFPGAG